MSIQAVGLPAVQNTEKAKATAKTQANQQVLQKAVQADSFEKANAPKKETSTGKKIGVGLASFLITGLGQAVNGQWGKAAGFFFGGLAGLVTFPPIGLAVGIWSIVDAVKNA